MGLIHPVFITDSIYQSHKCFTFMAASDLCSCALPITVLWRSTVYHGVRNKFLVVANVFVLLHSLVHNYATVTIIRAFIWAKTKCGECRCIYKRSFRLLCGSENNNPGVFWPERSLNSVRVECGSLELPPLTCAQRLSLRSCSLTRTGQVEGAACAKVEDYWPQADSAPQTGPRTAFATVSSLGCGILDVGLRWTVDAGSRVSGEPLQRWSDHGHRYI